MPTPTSASRSIAQARPEVDPGFLDYLDVLSLRTGKKLADVKVKGTKPTIGQIFIGPGAVYYTATETHDPHGYVTRVTAG